VTEIFCGQHHAPAEWLPGREKESAKSADKPGPVVDRHSSG